VLVEPCSTQVADHPAGRTWTFILRRHRGQKRGGSSSRAAAQAGCGPAAVTASPQRSHQMAVCTVVTGWPRVP
jgi:hypothetical protein